MASGQTKMEAVLVRRALECVKLAYDAKQVQYFKEGIQKLVDDSLFLVTLLACNWANFKCEFGELVRLCISFENISKIVGRVRQLHFFTFIVNTNLQRQINNECYTLLDFKQSMMGRGMTCINTGKKKKGMKKKNSHFNLFYQK